MEEAVADGNRLFHPYNDYHYNLNLDSWFLLSNLFLGSPLGVELSHYTKQITHHINGDIDTERDTLMQNLEQAKQLVSTYQVTGVGANWQGKNGGGDTYYTDGEITVGVISPNNLARTIPTATAANPPAVELKNKVWSWMKHSSSN